MGVSLRDQAGGELVEHLQNARGVAKDHTAVVAHAYQIPPHCGHWLRTALLHSAEVGATSCYQGRGRGPVFEARAGL